MPMIADQSLFIPGLLDGKGIMRSNSGRRLERNRKFADSPLEGNGFEPLVLLAAYAQVIDLMQIHLGAGAAMVQLFFFLSASNHSTEPAEARIEQVVACCASAAASACRRKSSRNRKFADLYGGFSVKWFFGLLPVPCLERKGRSSSRRLRSGSRSARKGVKGPKC